jgi:DNA-binding transcriptional LysR family regulator
MDIRQLQHLVALVELGTVHAAAEQQHISQPGLSGSIKRLEGQLGIALFERDGRGMRANAKGKEFYQHAKHILQQVKLARADLQGAITNLVIGLGEVRPSGFAGALQHALLKAYPGLTLTFAGGHFETLYTKVENGDVDVAFVAAPPDISSTLLTGNLLAKGEWCVFCSAGHPLASYDGHVPLGALKSYNWVKNGATPAMAPFVPGFTGRNKNPLTNIGYVTAASQQMALELILNSDLLGYGPRLTLDREFSHGEIVELDLPITKRYITIMEIRRRDVLSTVLDRTFSIAEDFFQNQALV